MGHAFLWVISESFFFFFDLHYRFHLLHEYSAVTIVNSSQQLFYCSMLLNLCHYHEFYTVVFISWKLIWPESARLMGLYCTLYTNMKKGTLFYSVFKRMIYKGKTHLLNYTLLKNKNISLEVYMYIVKCNFLLSMFSPLLLVTSLPLPFHTAMQVNDQSIIIKWMNADSFTWNKWFRREMYIIYVYMYNAVSSRAHLISLASSHKWRG